MRITDIVIGETYLLPVVATEVSNFGNMVRLVTADEGEVIWAHPEALTLKRGEPYDSQ